jgi:multidrug resistance efflux pump
VLAVLAHVGESVGPAGLLQMGDLSQIYVDTLVFIDDIPGVHVGQTTQVTGSALPPDGLSGVVTSISPMVAGNTLPNPDPTVFSDQTVVLVKVRLDNAAPAAGIINGQVTVRFAP